MRDSPSVTAEAVCFMRAADQRRKPEFRILDDPLAKLFLGSALRATLGAVERTGKLGEFLAEDLLGIATYVLARHRFIDEALLEALASKEVEQVVLLGAGYDTRPYRFAEALGARPIFEVDHPSTGRRKAQIVKEHPDLRAPTGHRLVEINFESESVDQRLIEAGFKKGARTFFIWEGVSMYLTRRAVQGTLTQLHALGGAGSDLCMDFWYFLDAPDLISTAHRLSVNLLHFLGEPITFGIHPEDGRPFLERLDYQVVDLADATELERRFVRDGRRVYPANFVVHARTRAGA
jgi:methyltransferase (TIGR00027 family)